MTAHTTEGVEAPIYREIPTAFRSVYFEIQSYSFVRLFYINFEATYHYFISI